MRKLFITLLLLVFAVSCFGMEMDQFKKLKTGDIIHVKIVWNDKVYLEGDAVIQFLVPENESAQCASIDKAKNFYSTFHRSFLTLVSVKPSDDLQAIKQENETLKQIIRTLLDKLKSIVAEYVYP